MSMHSHAVDLTPNPTPPAPLLRPKIRRWRQARDLTLQDLGAACGKSKQWAQMIELPFGDPKRRIPAEADVEALFDYTGGEVGPPDWYHPRLSPPAATDAGAGA